MRHVSMKSFGRTAVYSCLTYDIIFVTFDVQRHANDTLLHTVITSCDASCRRDIYNMTFVTSRDVAFLSFERHEKNVKTNIVHSRCI